MQYVEFILGNAVLTPPIQRDAKFLTGERITLGEQAFVVMNDDQPASPRQSHGTDGAAPAQIRRIVVVEAWRWTKPVIDRDFNWPTTGEGTETGEAGPPKSGGRKKPESKPPKPRDKGKRSDPP